MMKKIVLIFIVLVIVVFLYSSFGPKIVSGKVVDSNKKGISGITVRIFQRGWGLSPYLVWDKDYLYETETGSDGKFKVIYYRGGTDAHLQVYKGNYEDNIKNVKNVYINFWEHPVIEYLVSK